MINDEQILKELVKRDELRQEILMRNVVSQVSRGNVYLQLGRYITEKDKENMRKAMFSYQIKAPI